MSKKIRADSILGTLPEERQAEIAEHARSHKLTETQYWLAQDGVRIGLSALSDWLSSWRLRQGFKRAESSAAEFRDWLAREFPKFSEAELDARAALFFQSEAVKTGDAETYLAFATARHKAEVDKARLKIQESKLQIDSRRLALLEKKAEQADAASKVVESPLSAEEKQLKLRQIFGMT